MTLDTKNESSAQHALVESRQRVEDRLEALRDALDQTTGGRLMRSGWTLPLLAAAVGFSVATLLRRGARRRRRRAGDRDDDY